LIDHSDFSRVPVAFVSSLSRYGILHMDNGYSDRFYRYAWSS
jgi:hypothetical protein